MSIFYDNMPLEDQVRELANFIMFEIPGEPSRSEGAIECAVRLLRNTYKNQRDDEH